MDKIYKLFCRIIQNIFILTIILKYILGSWSSGYDVALTRRSFASSKPGECPQFEKVKG